MTSGLRSFAARRRTCPRCRRGLALVAVTRHGVRKLECRFCHWPRQVHKPDPDSIYTSPVDLTLCGRKASDVLTTDAGIEAVTCRTCIRVYDGI